MMSNEILEHVIYFGGPKVAAKLSITSKGMYATFHVTMRETVTSAVGTVVVMNDPRWSRYWNLRDYEVYLMHDIDYFKTHLTIISRQSGSMLKAMLMAKHGRHMTKSGSVVLEIRNSGLLENPITTQYRFNFTLDDTPVKLRILHDGVNNRIMSVMMYD